MNQENDKSFLELQVDGETATQLHETCRWARMQGIMILVAFALCIFLFAGLWDRMSAMFFSPDEVRQGASGIFKYTIIGVLVVGGVVIGIMMSFLIKGANQTRNALLHKDPVMLNLGLANLRNYFVMYGILSILQLLFALMDLAR